MPGRIVAHAHNCRCKGCKNARAEEARGDLERTPPWPLSTRRSPQHHVPTKGEEGR